MIYTEKDIKAQLDGHYYILHSSARGVEVLDLSRDKRPVDEWGDDDAPPPKPGNIKRASVKPNSINWEGKDDTIIELRRAGKTFTEIGKALGMDRTTVRWRFVRLCGVLGIDPEQHCHEYKKFNAQIEADIVAARNGGETFQGIGQRFGMSKASVCTLYYRWYRRTHQEDAA